MNAFQCQLFQKLESMFRLNRKDLIAAEFFVLVQIWRSSTSAEKFTHRFVTYTVEKWINFRPKITNKNISYIQMWKKSNMLQSKKINVRAFKFYYWRVLSLNYGRNWFHQIDSRCRLSSAYTFLPSSSTRTTKDFCTKPSFGQLKKMRKYILSQNNRDIF
jgi:hypothetical protein